MPTKQDINSIRSENAKRRMNVTLFKAPLTTIKIFLIVVRLYTINWLNYVLSHKRILSLLSALAIIFTTIYFVPGEHQSLVRETEATIILGGWWVLLGVLSSVGLGTGLHTFVLYLGPFIAKVTMAATECNSVNFKKYGSDSFLCPDQVTSEHEVTLWNVLRMVQFESLLWGAGTALGELPPYFVARAARLAGERIEELQEIETSIDNENFVQKLVHKTKKLMFSTLGNLGFFGIMLFASIPNPLFDLAGITSGHFLIPFTTFFGATLIGKAVIKAHIQTIFVISMFRPAILSYWINLIESILPFTKGSIDEFLLNQRSQFHRNSSTTHTPQKGLLGLAWDCVLFGMLFYFLISIINSSVQSYLAEKDEEELSKLNISDEKTDKKSN